MPTKSRSILIAAGAICFLVSLVASMPARIIVDLLASDNLRVGSVGGTVWNGETRLLNIAGLEIRRISWDLHAWSLFTGRLSADIDLQLPDGFARGALALSVTGSISIRDFEATAPVSAITRWMNLPQTTGDASVQIRSLDISNGWPRTAVGSARVGNVPLNLPGVPPTAAGSYQVSFDVESVPDDGKFSGELTDQGGVLEIFGTIQLSPPSNYDISGLINARPGAPAGLAEGLVLLGPAGPGGRHEFSLSGSF